MTWLTILLLYCLVSGAMTLAILRLCGGDEDVGAVDPDVTAFFVALGTNQNAIDRMSDPIEAEASREFARLHPFRIELIGVAISPIFLPIVICWLGYCEVRKALRDRQVQKVGRTYREYQFVPVNSMHLPKWIQKTWEQHTPTLFQTRFEMLGDYRLKPEPIEVHDRFFLSDQGDILATVCCVLEQSALSLMTVLEDGTVVESANCTDPKPECSFEPADRLQVLYLPGVPLKELEIQHRDVLHRLVAERQANVVRIDRENFQRVALHGQRVFCRWRDRHNELDQPPPLPDFEQFAAMPTVSVSEPQFLQSEQHLAESAQFICNR